MAKEDTKGCLMLAIVVWIVFVVVALLTEKLQTTAGNIMFGMCAIGAIAFVINSANKK